MFPSLSLTWTKPTTTECSAAGSRFVSPYEYGFDPCFLNPFLPGCATCFYEPSLPQCSDDCDFDPWGPNCPVSPVIIDLAANGLRLSGPQPPVLFDLDADGEGDLTSWTRRRTDDGFLALDRNGNGHIDDATELFGTATQLASGQLAPNGFVALAELDGPALGGNADRAITAADSTFTDLLIWRDDDRDGESEAGELFALSELGVVAISLDYSESEIEDLWGNEFRLWSRVRTTEGDTWPVDVFFRRFEIP